MKNLISPSLLAADKSRLGEEIKLVESLGAEYIHWDVMDGKFVPNKSYTSAQVKEFAKCHKMVNDVHIMVVDPEVEGPEFVNAGADLVTFHIEAVDFDKAKIEAIINDLHRRGSKAGLSLKPNTKVETVLPYLDKLELILVMSVEPGLGGQKFIPNALDKIKVLREYIDKHHLSCLIEVDGGVNGETGKLCREAGADILVAGSYLFGHDDIAERIKTLR